MPLMPRKQCTLHGVQGKTADPGFIMHWSFPPGLVAESIWLAYYVGLSRPRSFPKMLSHGLPLREIIEGGPPKSITEAFQEMFETKIKNTKLACAKARAKMGWPGTLKKNHQKKCCRMLPSKVKLQTVFDVHSLPRAKHSYKAPPLATTLWRSRCPWCWI